MTLIEALKSGKKIRRPGLTEFMTPSESYTQEEILDPNWEVKEETIQVSRQEFLLAMQLRRNYITPECLFDSLKKGDFK